MQSIFIVNNGHFSYQIRNSKNNSIELKKGQFVTDKTDKTAHGIGLKNICELVDKYQGHIDFNYTEEEFSIVILI